MVVTGAACLMAAGLVSFSLGIFLIGVGGERKGMWVIVCLETAAKFSILYRQELDCVYHRQLNMRACITFHVEKWILMDMQNCRQNKTAVAVTALHRKTIQLWITLGLMIASSKCIWEENEGILQNKICSLSMTYTEHWAYRKSIGPDK